MNTPFPGMDPYLEHPILWESIHARLIVAIANQLQPRLDPRYVASIEERVFVEGPQRRIPDVWIQKAADDGNAGAVGVALAEADAAMIVEVEGLELRETRVEILDAYNNMKLVAIIEVVSPTNKAAGPGRKSYIQKQREVLERDCHLVEIDLMRCGRHVVSVPASLADSLAAFDYLVCVNRWTRRDLYEVYPRRLRERLPRLALPLADPDPDVVFDVQAALEQVYVESRYARRVRYDRPCDPPLNATDQQWANECLAAYRAAHPELFPSPPAP
jgi:hypothetical protein